MICRVNKILVFVLIIILVNNSTFFTNGFTDNAYKETSMENDKNDFSSHNNDLLNGDTIFSSNTNDENLYNGIIFRRHDAYSIINGTKSYYPLKFDGSRKWSYGSQFIKTLALSPNIPKVKSLSLGDSDWIVTGQEIHRDEIIFLRGNLIIEPGGNLTFINVTLYMNCSKDGEFQIRVKSGASFQIYDGSIITCYNTSCSYLFYVDVNAKFRMIDSELHYCGYSYDYVGLVVSTDDVLLKNCLFSMNYYGIYINQTSLSLVNCTFQENKECGIYAYRSIVSLTNCSAKKNRHGFDYYQSNGMIINCISEDNEWGASIIGVSDNYCNITINKCNFTGNTASAITSSHAYVTIMDCIINHNNGGVYSQFCHVNISNSDLCNNYGDGAFFEGDSVKIRILNCSLYGNDGNGIHTGQKTITYIYNCNLSLNGNSGVDACRANLTMINNSICNNRNYGVFLDYRFNNYNFRAYIINNTFVKNTIYLDGYYLDEFFHEIENNTINGKPLYYIVNETNYAVPSDAGAVIIVNSTKPMITNLQFSSVQLPIFLAYVRDPLIEKLMIYDNFRAVRCYRSKNITIRDIIVYNLTDLAIFLYESNGTIYNINIENVDGITVWGCHNLHIFNVSTRYGEYGIVSWFSHHILIEDCNLSFNDYSGFLCFDSTNITLRNIVAYNNSEKATLLDLGAIDCTDSNITLVKSLVFNNTIYGIRLMKSSITTIESSIFDNVKDGIYGEESTIITEKSNITRNYYGVYGYRSNITLSNSNFSENYQYGVYGYESNLEIADSTLTRNEKSGISLAYSNATIHGNLIHKNGDSAIYFISSYVNITHNLIYDNEEFGIHFSSSMISDITQNTFMNNGIFMYGESIDQFIHNIENNTVNGKPLYYLLNAENIVLSGEVGAVIIVNSTSILIHSTSILATDVAIELAYSNDIKLENLTLKNNRYGIYCTNTIGNITNCEITNNTMGMLIHENSPLEIHYNNIYSNEKLGLLNEDYGTEINATYNWWGSPDGPVLSTFGDATDPEEIYGSIIYSPWLTFHWPDIDPPVIQVLCPINNSYVRSFVNINISAIDDESGMFKVVFYIDGTLVSEDYQAPYEFKWDTTAYTDGSHEIKVQAYDNFNNVAEECLIVIVDNTAPVIITVTRSPEQPLENEEVTVLANVQDEVSGIAFVVLIYEVNEEANQINMAYEENVWRAQIPGKPAGTVVSYRVLVYDKAGNMVESAVYAYTVKQSKSTTPGITFIPIQTTKIIFLLIAVMALIPTVILLSRKKRQ